MLYISSLFESGPSKVPKLWLIDMPFKMVSIHPKKVVWDSFGFYHLVCFLALSKVTKELFLYYYEFRGLNIFNVFQNITFIILTDDQTILSLVYRSLFFWLLDPLILIVFDRIASTFLCIRSSKFICLFCSRLEVSHFTKRFWAHLVKMLCTDPNLGIREIHCSWVCNFFWAFFIKN